MKILVTGGAGFIGSSLIRYALSQGHTIFNVDALTYAASKESLCDVMENEYYFFEHIDIRNKDSLKKVFTKHQPDAVMHLAAESHVDRSIESPLDFIETNILGTFNLLEVSLNYWEEKSRPKTFRFHHVSTDEVFGSLSNETSILFTEETPYDPRSPYSASKASSDHLVRAWYETYGLPVIVTNCSNNYGPHQFPEKLIPLILLNAIAEKPLPIYGDGSNIRDWLYVDDHVKALLLVLQEGKIGRTYNIGGSNEFSNLQLVKTLCSILDRLSPRYEGSYEELIEFVADRPGHDTRYAINAGRIKEELGWEPSVTVEEGLEKTVCWYLENESWWGPLFEKNGPSKYFDGSKK